MPVAGVSQPGRIPDTDLKHTVSMAFRLGRILRNRTHLIG